MHQDLLHRERQLSGIPIVNPHACFWPKPVFHPPGRSPLPAARLGRSRTPFPPVTWSTCMMGECDDENLPRTFQDDDIKRKALEAKTLHAARSGRKGYWP